MSIHKTRHSSMTWNYVGLGLTIAAVLAALTLVAAGWVSIELPAWRLTYLLAPLAVILVMRRMVRNLGGR